ncbi:MAG: hypothetical protein RAK22_00205 [Nanoarchaeota archaeon]|nr:hypothetical protein [Nanoarchaeota archaeon]
MKGEIIKREDDSVIKTDTEIFYDIQKVEKVLNRNTLLIIESLSKRALPIDDLSKTTKIPMKMLRKYLETLEEYEIVKKNSKRQRYEVMTNGLSLIFNKEKLQTMPTSEIDANTKKFYEEFIKDNKFNGYICVGSPDPHGDYSAIARDTHFAIYLGMFLGKLTDLPQQSPVVLDTAVISRNLYKNNLILIGGPVTNLITRDINNFLPIKFTKEEGWALKSQDKFYNRDYEGILAKIKNPYDKTKAIILMGGIRNIGTLSAILAATRFSKFTFRSYEGTYPWYTMVRGYDIDGDGEIDSVETQVGSR